MSVDTWIQDYLIPSSFQYGGVNYQYGFGGSQGTLAGNRAMEVSKTLPGYYSAIRQSPPAFAAQSIRAAVISQVRFMLRHPPSHPKKPRQPRAGNSSMRLLEKPWPNGSTGELVARMEWHEALDGISYVARRNSPDGPRLQVLRPDWAAVLWGSMTEEENAGHALDRVLLGYVYQNGGIYNGLYNSKPEFLLPDECIHWAPNPDPLDASMGMSWLTPAIREIQSDVLASQHKIRYWENGATPNLVVKGIPAVTPTQFNEIVDMMEERHRGAGNAFRTLYLTGTADAEVIGDNFQKIDFRQITASGETRVAMLSHVPGSLLGTTDGQQGSSLNAGNFAAARRTFADTWVYPTLQDLAKSLAPLVTVPQDGELWYDTQDIGLLREDAKDQAEIDTVKANSISTLVTAGFKPETAVKTIAPDWVTTLEHTGMLSVQMQPPGQGIKNSNSAGALLDPHNDSTN